MYPIQYFEGEAVVTAPLVARESGTDKLSELAA
jgi:hypothetical protein